MTWQGLLLAGLALVVSGCTGGGPAGETDGPESSAQPTVSVSPPVARWKARTEEQRAGYLRALALGDARLGESAMADAGVEVCTAMFELRTDDQLIALVQREAERRVAAQVSPEAAVEVVVETHKWICPDLQR